MRKDAGIYFDNQELFYPPARLPCRPEIPFPARISFFFPGKTVYFIIGGIAINGMSYQGGR